MLDKYRIEARADRPLLQLGHFLITRTYESASRNTGEK